MLWESCAVLRMKWHHHHQYHQPGRCHQARAARAGVAGARGGARSLGQVPRPMGSVCGVSVASVLELQTKWLYTTTGSLPADGWPIRAETVPGQQRAAPDKVTAKVSTAPLIASSNRHAIYKGDKMVSRQLLHTPPYQPPGRGERGAVCCSPARFIRACWPNSSPGTGIQIDTTDCV